MLPDINNRINNLIKSLEHTIAPAVDDSDALATEQVVLVIEHLKVIRTQWDKALRFERKNLSEILALAAGACEVASGGEKSLETAQTLRQVISVNQDVTIDCVADAEQAYAAVGESLDQLISASFTDGSAAFKAELQRLIMAYTRTEAIRARTWFKQTGLDPDAASLPEIQSAL